MTPNNPTTKNSIRELVTYIKAGNYKAALHKFSYLTGIYGTYYGIAVLYQIDEKEQQGFLQALQDMCDPEIEHAPEVQENQDHTKAKKKR